MLGRCDKVMCRAAAFFKGYTSGQAVQACPSHAHELLGPLGDPLPVDAYGIPVIPYHEFGDYGIRYRLRLRISDREIVGWDMPVLSPGHRTVFTDFMETLEEAQRRGGILLQTGKFTGYEVLCQAGPGLGDWFKHPCEFHYDHAQPRA